MGYVWPAQGSVPAGPGLGILLISISSTISTGCSGARKKGVQRGGMSEVNHLNLEADLLGWIDLQRWLRGHIIQVVREAPGG